MKRPLLIVAPLAFLLVLALSACSSTPTAAPTAATSTGAPTSAAGAPTAAKPAASPSAQAQAPKSGGTLNLAINADVTTFDDYYQGGPGVTFWNQGQQLIGGDWSKGPAGGFGTKETDWASNNYDLLTNETGWLAESWTVNVDSATNTGVWVLKIRQGVHFAGNPNGDAAKLVNGREMTADDVVATLKEGVGDKRGWNYRNYPGLRDKTEITKTGPWEVTVKMPQVELISAVHGLGKTQRIYPAEIATNNIDTAKWQNQVTTGPFVLTDYVTGSTVTLKKNANYWMKDPVGPGKGNQLPYLDGVNLFIIVDPSTRLTAFRTAKIDQLAGLTWEDAAQISKESPQMPTALGDYLPPTPMYMRTDKTPYSDVRVRRALIMATDFATIKQTINGGNGIIISYPYELYKGYEDLYVDVDASPTIKEMYTYNPDGAKKLLADAGYPNGFKSSIMMTQPDSSLYEAIASMWAKVGVQLSLDIKDTPSLTNAVNALGYNDMVASPGKGPATSYYVGSTLNGAPGFANPSFVNDQKILDYLPKMRTSAVTDIKQSHALAKEMATYAVEQAFAIPRPTYRTNTFWWPWLKNYSGEISVGFIYGSNFTNWVWIDQDLKKSMGH